MNAFGKAVALLFAIHASTASAQDQAASLARVPPLATPGFSATFFRFFGDHTNFSADVEVKGTRDPGGESFVTPWRIALLDGKSRIEMHFAQAKGWGGDTNAVQRLRNARMGNVVIICSPAQNRTFMVYPEQEAYAEIDFPEHDRIDIAGIKVKTTELDRESLDGHPCIRERVVISDKDEDLNEAIVWVATDLGNFPVRIETQGGRAELTLTFTNIRLEKPDSKLFEPPPKFRVLKGPGAG